MHQQQTLHIKYSLKDGNQSSIVFHLVWIKAVSCQIWIKDKYKFYGSALSQSCLNELFILSGELFPLNHLPLTSAEQNDCEAEENSTVGPSHVGERPTQTKLKYNQKLVHLSAILLCLATEQPLKWWSADQYPWIPKYPFPLPSQQSGQLSLVFLTFFRWKFAVFLLTGM